MLKCTTNHCHHDALEGSDKCKSHGNEVQRVRRYKLVSKNLQERLDDLSTVDNMTSLRGEVALAQTALEERINSLGDSPAASEVAGAHAAINDSLRTIEKLVASMHKHDLANDEVLSKVSIIKLCGDIIDVIANRLAPFEDHVDYPGVIDSIDQDILLLVDRATND